jgi:hypothetical protein
VDSSRWTNRRSMMFMDKLNAQESSQGYSRQYALEATIRTTVYKRSRLSSSEVAQLAIPLGFGSATHWFKETIDAKRNIARNVGTIGQTKSI